MIRKIKMIIVTIIIRIFHPKGLIMKGVQDLRFDTEIRTKNKGIIKLGKRTVTYRGVTLTANGGNITIGDNVFFNRNCIVASLEQIIIGDRCIFGPNVIIYDHDHKYTENGIVKDEYKKSPIVIEKNCWIGANAAILRGTRIGEGCVIGAGTIIKGDIPPKSIVISNKGLSIRQI